MGLRVCSTSRYLEQRFPVARSQRRRTSSTVSVAEHCTLAEQAAFAAPQTTTRRNQSGEAGSCCGVALLSDAPLRSPSSPIDKIDKSKQEQDAGPSFSCSERHPRAVAGRDTACLLAIQSY